MAEPPQGPTLPSDPRDLDGLEYLAGRSISEINAMALRAVAEAHRDGGVPNVTVELPGISEGSLGSLLFFFEFAVSVSGRLLAVNPFDQPGVEAYKTNLFRLLGKPGFEFNDALAAMVHSRGIVGHHLTISDERSLACACVVLEAAP